MTDSNRNVTREALNDYVHLVRIAVARFGRRLPPSVQRDDLTAAAMFGLVRALQASGHIRETSPEMFTAYARIRIRGAILDELRRNDWSPRRRRAQQQRPESASVPPPSVRVMGFDDLSPEALGQCLADAAQDPTAGTWGTQSPEQELEARTWDAEIRRCIEDLPARERVIVQMRYFDGISSKEVASILGVSEARVSQLHARAMATLRELLVIADVSLAA